MTRRGMLRLGAGAAATLLVPLLVSCGSTAVVSELDLSATQIVPDGTGVHDEADVGFTLYKRAEVGAMLIGPDGKQYPIRDPQLRAPDRYQIPFRGLVGVPGHDWLRVVPDGSYKFVLNVKDLADGKVVTREANIQIKGADTTAPELSDILVNPATFSPNGDGIDDLVTVSYRLSKDAMVRVFATDTAGGFFLVQAPTKTLAALHSFEWMGTEAGGNQVLKDGKYNLHLEATDTAGNFTDVVTPVAIENGGTPRAELTDVRFSPTALAVGMDLQVHMTIKNTGDVPLRTLGPPPGTKYTTSQNYSSFPRPGDPNTPMYFEQPGVWRACVSWQNAPQTFPVRWGFFAPTDATLTSPERQLMPGESVTIDGTITVLFKTQQSTVIFFAGLEQGGVGFPGGQVGQTKITVSY
jgi:hypothetical protein